ncbi:helix-turn-helix domain-containing protein [Cryobacterium psychrophilum]|uniref:Helix-turn-helix domain-containing protein n=1 Tax=Cryobacterium psychrophilum TaxID=41988 RepID=A0A4Y8KW40_9MICO|nr:helix-turn-helix domain-containing protein [Cryobacterium psychrophilum]TFD80534.1 helix-turn-helix domain-containing protein [Cryobacterium psychrophilum]
MANETFTMIPNWVLRNGILEPFELSIYLVLLSHRDHKTGTAWPSFDTIAREAGMSRSKVIRTLPKLTARGLVTITQRRRGSGDNAPNLYNVGVFKRAEPVDNSKPKKGPRFESTSESSLGSGSQPPPSGSQLLGGSGSQPPEEEPLTSRTKEEDLRSDLSEIRREISFETSNPFASQGQLDYLKDLFIHFNDEIPKPETMNRWADMEPGQASILIDSYLSQIPRYDSYEGPESGDDTYEALSLKGQQWADTGFIPDIREVA